MVLIVVTCGCPRVSKEVLFCLRDFAYASSRSGPAELSRSPREGRFALRASVVGIRRKRAIANRPYAPLACFDRTNRPYQKWMKRFITKTMRSVASSPINNQIHGRGDRRSLGTNMEILFQAGVRRELVRG